MLRKLVFQNKNMMTNFRQPQMMSMVKMPIRSFYYPDGNHHHLNQEPHVLAKRVIKICGDRLRHIDPNRWDGVPITYKTNWNSEADEICIKTVINIHDAIEREFNIEIDDRKHLLVSVEDCF